MSDKTHPIGQLYCPTRKCWYISVEKHEKLMAEEVRWARVARIWLREAMRSAERAERERRRYETLKARLGTITKPYRLLLQVMDEVEE